MLMDFRVIKSTAASPLHVLLQSTPSCCGCLPCLQEDGGEHSNHYQPVAAYPAQLQLRSRRSANFHVTTLGLADSDPGRA